MDKRKKAGIIPSVVLEIGGLLGQLIVAYRL